MTKFFAFLLIANFILAILGGYTFAAILAGTGLGLLLVTAFFESLVLPSKADREELRKRVNLG